MFWWWHCTSACCSASTGPPDPWPTARTQLRAEERLSLLLAGIVKAPWDDENWVAWSQTSPSLLPNRSNPALWDEDEDEELVLDDEPSPSEPASAMAPTR